LLKFLELDLNIDIDKIAYNNISNDKISLSINNFLKLLFILKRNKSKEIELAPIKKNFSVFKETEIPEFNIEKIFETYEVIEDIEVVFEEKDGFIIINFKI